MKNLFGGIDGCRGGWIFIYGTKTEIMHSGIYKNLEPILEIIEDKKIRTSIDMAIGLNEKSVRECDKLAAEKIDAKQSSVFPMPGVKCLQQIEEPYFTLNNYSKFRTFNEEHLQKCDRRIPLATFCIMNKLYEVNVQFHKKILPLQKKGLIFEFHPELFFYANKIRSKKKTRKGFEDRVAFLKQYFSRDLYIERKVMEIRMGKSREIQKDDVVDAFAGVLLSSGIQKGEIRSDKDESPHGFDIFIKY